MFKGCLLCVCTMGFLTFVPIILRKRALSVQGSPFFHDLRSLIFLTSLNLNSCPQVLKFDLFFKKYPHVIIVFQQIKSPNLYITLSSAFQTSIHLCVDGSLTVSFIYFLYLLNSKETGY